MRGKGEVQMEEGKRIGWNSDILVSVVLLVFAFPLCAYGVKGMMQANYLGALSLTLGIICFGLSCMGPTKLKCYIKGENM